jgi:hypothetical protein
MDSTDMSDDENAMLVALQHGNRPRDEDPVAKALEARGLVGRSSDGSSWELTPSGAGYVAELAPG